jgi:hypothetical protein
MKFTNLKMDFEIPKAKLGNYFHGNLIILESGITYFEFPELLQSETFVLQLMTFDKTKMTYSFSDALILDNSYKKTGYFESYNFVTNLALGIYRIKAGDYYSGTLIKTTETVLNDDFNYLVDNVGDYFVDDVGDFLTELI